MTTYILVIVLSYLLGSLNPSYFITKAKKGIDIRTVGSNNPGTSNAVMTLGLSLGVVVFIIDSVKALVPVLIVKLLLNGSIDLQFIAGFSAIIGHIFPIFLNFKGGKGTATFLGMMLAFDPRVGGILLLTIIVFSLISDSVIWGTFSVYVALAITLYLYGYLDESLVITIISIVYILISFIKHYENFVKILRGEGYSLKKAITKKSQ